MKTLSKSVVHILVTMGMFVLLGTLIVLILPKHTTYFQYNFELGKPWGYSLLTAEQDFPIYKTDKQLAADKKEALATYAPYFSVLTDQRNLGLQRVDSSSLSPSVKKQMWAELNRIYQKGIISLSDFNSLQQQGVSALMLVEGGVAWKANLTDFYTPKSAYAALMSLFPDSLASNIIGFDLIALCNPTIAADKATSQRVYQSIVDGVSTTQGMVQTGERIIDRGEVVSEKTYQVLLSLKKAYEAQESDQRQAILATVADSLLVLIFLALLYSYLFFYRRPIINHILHTGFICLMLAAMVGLTALLVRYTSLSIFLIPVVWVPVLARTFYDSLTALLLHSLTIMLMAFYVSNPEEFIFIQLIVGVVTVFSLHDLTQRAQLFHTALWVLLAYAVSYTAFKLSVNGDFSSIDPWQYLYFTLNALLVILAYGLIYLFEKPFNLVSPITLVELTNVNNPLLAELADRAPGTFQHSLQVSNLAAAAAERIGANSLLVRTGALYHDIGKLSHPELFTENQQEGDNPLLTMSPQDASQHIIAHVPDGVELAHKFSLPEVLISFIQTHHGKGRVRYFYNTYCNEHHGEIIDDSLFTYPGPQPESKETTILLLADAIEARSRSLSVYSEQSIRQMVGEMISAAIADGLLDHSRLSFRDVEAVKQVFIQKLLSINHHRIAYPTLQR